MNEEKTNSFDSINIKSYLSSLIIILILMIVTYVLTFILPSGNFVNVQGESLPIYQTIGNEPLPFWKFILSPILVVAGFDGFDLLLEIIAFLLVIGGVFEALTRCNFMEYALKKIVSKFYNKRYALIYIITLFFMLMGSFVGSFEEVIPLIPFICALTTSLGFDNLVGLGISILAAGGGFASGIMNPFTIGIAQQIAEVPLFSGVWIRILTFICIYILLTTFMLLHAKKVEKVNKIKVSEYKTDFEKDEKLDRAILTFGIILGIALILVISSVVIKALQDYTLIIFALGFLAAGVAAPLISGMKPKELLKAYGRGAFVMLPGVLMILFASSIRYILVESNRLDTIIYKLMNATQGLSPYIVILLIYLIVLITEVFIASGSAKAFLLIPLLLPISQGFGISANLVCLAYIFGDGFSNYIYPTDAATIISLKLSGSNYAKYIKQTWPYHLLTFIVTSGILMLGLAVGY